jgi:hypothetical protein
MPLRDCPHCARRLPYAGRRCVHCDWVLGADHRPGAGIAWWRRTALWALAVTLFIVVAAQYAYRNAAAIADWYATYATQYRSAETSTLPPSHSADDTHSDAGGTIPHR